MRIVQVGQRQAEDRYTGARRRVDERWDGFWVAVGRKGRTEEEGEIVGVVVGRGGWKKVMGRCRGDAGRRRREGERREGGRSLGRHGDVRHYPV